MNGIDSLKRELDTLPKEYFDEVINFISWLKYRKIYGLPETVILSENTLRKDWDTPEEDEAWANL